MGTLRISCFLVRQRRSAEESETVGEVVGYGGGGQAGTELELSPASCCDCLPCHQTALAFSLLVPRYAARINYKFVLHKLF